jgi:predicted transcriptional regulator
MSRKELASLGAAEAEILQLVWELGEATVQEIHERLPRDRGIAPATVQTVLRRLRDKGYVKSRADGKAHVFSSSVKPETVISKTVKDLVNRFFGGKAAPLMLHLAQSEKLAEDDLDRLRNLLKSDPKKEGEK